MSSSQGIESCGSGMAREGINKSDKKTKSHLSPMEEKILLASLKELVANGWKSDNGFRGGYLTKLEELMRKEISGTDLKGIPHLNSKIQTWKKNYNSLTAMLSLSGIGFNEQMIECINEQWEQIVKMDANAKAMRNRKWPMYDAWKKIFGKDRATGENAEDVLDAMNELFNEETRALDETMDDYYVSLDHLDDNNVAENSVCGSGNDVENHSVYSGARREAIPKSVGKKRKVKETANTVAEVLREMSRNTNARLDTIAQRIGYEYDLDEAKNEAFAQLKNIPELSLGDKFELCEIFADKNERFLIFKGLPDSARPNMCSGY